MELVTRSKYLLRCREAFHLEKSNLLHSLSEPAVHASICGPSSGPAAEGHKADLSGGGLKWFPVYASSVQIDKPNR
jgi:hypothetical protein